MDFNVQHLEIWLTVSCIRPHVLPTDIFSVVHTFPSSSGFTKIVYKKDKPLSAIHSYFACMTVNRYEFLQFVPYIATKQVPLFNLSYKSRENLNHQSAHYPRILSCTSSFVLLWGGVKFMKCCS